jgi:hypothetical protein
MTSGAYFDHRGHRGWLGPKPTSRHPFSVQPFSKRYARDAGQRPRRFSGDRAGRGSGRSVGRSRWERILRATAESSIVATRWILRSHSGQARTSISNVRRRSSAHGMWRRGPERRGRPPSSDRPARSAGSGVGEVCTSPPSLGPLGCSGRADDDARSCQGVRSGSASAEESATASRNRGLA